MRHEPVRCSNGHLLDRSVAPPIEERGKSIPALLQGKERAHFVIAFDLILSLYQIAPIDLAVADLREMLRGRHMR
jgi:hypothetical protein